MLSILKVPFTRSWKTVTHFTRRWVTGNPTNITPEAEKAWLDEQLKVYATLQPYSSPITTPDGGLTAGETWEMRWGYRTMAMREPAVKSALLTKILAVAGLPVRVKPGAKEDGQAGRDAAAFLDFSVSSSKYGWPGAIKRVALPSAIDGFGVAEKVYDIIDPFRNAYPGYWTLLDLKDKDTQFIRFRLDTYRNITAVQAMTGGQGGFPFDPRDFIIFTHLMFFMNPFGVSDLRACVRAANLIEAAIKLRAILLENFSGPYLIGKANDTGVRQKLTQLLANARARGWIVIPQSAEVELVNLATSAPDQFQNSIRDYREEICTGIQGAYLHLMEGAIPNARGKTDAHESIAEIFLYWLAAELGSVFTHQLSPDLTIANFGRAITPPIVSIGGIDYDQVLKKLERFKALQDLGYSLSKEQVGEEGEAEVPKDENDVLQPAQNAGANPFGSGMGSGRLPNPTNDNMPQFSERRSRVSIHSDPYPILAENAQNSQPGHSAMTPPVRMADDRYTQDGSAYYFPKDNQLSIRSFWDTEVLEQFTGHDAPFMRFADDPNVLAFTQWKPYRNQRGDTEYISEGGLVRKEAPNSRDGGHVGGAKELASGLEHALTPEDHKEIQENPSIWRKCESMALTAAAHAYRLALRLTPAAMKLGSVLSDVLDTPSDLNKFCYNPTMSSGTANAGVLDPMKVHFGVSTHLACTIGANVLANIFHQIGKLVSSRKQMADFYQFSDDGLDELAELIQTVLATLRTPLKVDLNKLREVLSQGSANHPFVNRVAR